MPQVPFSVTTDYMHATAEGCVRVVAVPHITIYRIPHDFATNLASEPELKQAGIYLLINTENRTIYVGQADSRDNGNGVLARMLEPHKKESAIDQWDVGFAMTSGTPHFFGATELNYLERFFYDKAVEVGKYTVLNGNRPHATDVNFSTRNILGNYTDYAFFLLREQLHCNAFEKEPGKKTAQPVEKKKATVSVKKEESTEETEATEEKTDGNKDLRLQARQALTGEELTIDSTSKGVHAEGQLDNKNGIVVKAGSTISITSNLYKQKNQASIQKIRDDLIKKGVIKERIFTADHPFRSTSQAAAVILGTASSGNSMWISKDGKTLGQRLTEMEEQITNGELKTAKLHMTVRGSDAYGYRLETGDFVVRKGSRLSPDVTASFQKNSLNKQREILVEQGIIVDGTFACDWTFSSISTAASIIGGNSTNGNDAWKEE